MKFYGSNIDGKLSVDARLSEYIKSIDGNFEIKVTKIKDIRTAEMNNLYWWWMKILSDETGYTKNELHNYFKNKILCVEDQINGETFLDCKSTADLTIKEFSEYLLQVGKLGAEKFSVYLPDRLP